MPGQDADHVPALPGAEADRPYVPRGGMIEFSAQVPLHEFQPPREQGTWIVVVSVPFHPVALCHRAGAGSGLEEGDDVLGQRRELLARFDGKHDAGRPRIIGIGAFGSSHRDGRHRVHTAVMPRLDFHLALKGCQRRLPSHPRQPAASAARNPARSIPPGSS
jgi:hypothetical protein